MQSDKIIIGTRGSVLAVRQTEIVETMLSERGFEFSRKIVKTSGDVIQDKPLFEFQSFGTFVRELDDVMLRGEIDIAVHSMKDIPTERPRGLEIAAILPRDSPCDLLVTRDGSRLSELPAGSVIGTSSMRRRCQIMRERKDLKLEDIRGNIDTRVKKLIRGDYDAILLAEAGFERMGWFDGKFDLGFERLDPERFVPSANQGTIAVVAKTQTSASEIVSQLDDPETRLVTILERRIIEILGAGCKVPIGVYAEAEEDSGITIIAEILTDDGGVLSHIKKTVSRDGAISAAEKIGNELKSVWRG
ncbi:MAG: hydroxymethylbilane synthase [Candidatus Syntropharchaeales archaeon]